MGLAFPEASEWRVPGARNFRPSDSPIYLASDDQGGAIQINATGRSIAYVPGITITPRDDEVTFMRGEGAALSEAVERGDAVQLLKFKDVEYRARAVEKPSEETPFYVAVLEARWPAERKTKVLVDRVRIIGLSERHVASPNGLFGVLKYVEHGDATKDKRLRIRYVIVDGAGHIVDQVSFHHLDERVWEFRQEDNGKTEARR
jgi:hypothetical protein